MRTQYDPDDISLEYLREIEKMSVRAYNGCRSRCLWSLLDIIECFQEHRHFKELRNVGQKASDELVAICERYRDGVPPEIRERVAKMTAVNAPNSAEQFERLMEKCSQQFGLPTEKLLHFRDPFLEKRFPLFEFLHTIFSQEKGFSTRDLYIMRHRSGYFQEHRRQLLKEIAVTIGRGQERVRQLALAIPARIRRLLESLGITAEILDYKDLYSDTTDMIVLDNPAIIGINEREGVNFSPKFYALVFETILSGNYRRLKKEYDGESEYLICRGLFDSFDFNHYMEGLRETLHREITDSYTVDLRARIKLCIRSWPYQWQGEEWREEKVLSRVIAIYKYLAEEEFSLEIDADDVMVIPANIGKHLPSSSSPAVRE